ncbi:hypothetical protein EIN_136920 [Entamoeba invadens IP1]|uniref:Uncharacterized protein n=1 Tax=Entamoeba invadens IP1 TaxID=370355 RepID=A0A0A1TXH0_ENTIV|nr:hypothetical protein EIN_136920 [Entamoeba invadens IP1]ELP85988.1 hypothetical protein EIN_136920 [Entamoeba invadens IP1]|eukprot:XP_004185334.1 hypothetical protein EIN_136920 [Entamoeba invadens IP1]
MSNSTEIKNVQERNLYIAYQSVLMLLLSPSTSFIIGKPSHRATKTLNFIVVKELLVYEEDNKTFSIHLKELIKERAKQMIIDLKEKGRSELAAQRVVNYEKSRDSIDFLEDLLYLQGINVAHKKVNRFGLGCNVEIQLQDKSIWRRRVIQFIGEQINTYLYKRMEKQKEVEIKRNELTIWWENNKNNLK